MRSTGDTVPERKPATRATGNAGDDGVTIADDPPGAAWPTWPGRLECRFCRAPLTPLQSQAGVCDSRICAVRHGNERHRLRYRLKWDDFVETQHAGARAHGAEIVAGAQMLGLSVGDLEVGFVPRLDRPLVRLPGFRRDAFMAHVREITDAAFAQADPGPATTHRARNEAQEPAVGTAACIACRGHCCVLGMAANAFLRVETINHVRRHRPNLDADAVVSAYQARIPEQSVEGSCVYHGQAGCALDRTWRADMCNNFQCNGKRQALERAAGTTEMLWVATEDGTGRAMLHDGANTRPVAADAKSGDTGTPEAVATVRAKLPARLPETAPIHPTACRRCGAPIATARAASGETCGSAACDLAGRH